MGLRGGLPGTALNCGGGENRTCTKVHEAITYCNGFKQRYDDRHAVLPARPRLKGDTMEYALEGYGYSVARVVRGMLSQRQGAHGESLSSRDDHLLALLEADFTTFPESVVKRLIGALWRDADPQHAFKQPPELLSTLRTHGHRGRVNGLMWRVASATKATFDALRRVLQLRLTVCSIEKDDRGAERLLLGVYSPSLTADVRVNDPVSAGVLVALHSERGGGSCRLEVVPRVYRKICQNGAIVFVEDAPAREVPQGVLWGSEALEPLVAELEPMISACLDEKAFALAVSSFRRSAAEPIEDTALAASLGGRLSPEVERAVLARYRTGGDFTRWGLLNAVTAEARTAPSALMVKLERLGGTLARRPAAVGAHEVLMAHSMQPLPRDLKKPAAA